MVCSSFRDYEIVNSLAPRSSLVCYDVSNDVPDGYQTVGPKAIDALEQGTSPTHNLIYS